MADIWKTLNKLGRYGGHGGLKKYVLNAIMDHPKNGVEIIESIEAMSYGAWKPSPGSIYPLLNKLTEDGLVRKLKDGRYEIVMEEYDAFGAMWPNKRYTVEGVITEMESDVSYLEDINKEELRPFGEKLSALNERIGRLQDSLKK